MADLQELLVKIDATTEGLRRELRKASGDTKKFQNNVNKSLISVDKAFRKLRGVVLAAGIPLGINAIAQSIRAVVAESAQLGDTADKLGLSVEALQELRFAAEQTGVAQNTLDLALQRFTRRVGEARQGSGELKDTLREYNIALVDSEGNTRSNVDILGDLANSIATAGDDAERLRIAFKAFDSEGAALVNTLRDGSAGLEDLREQARDAGAVLSDQAVRGAQDFDKELKKLTASASAAIKGGLLDLINSIRGIEADSVEELTGKLGQLRERLERLQIVLAATDEKTNTLFFRQTEGQILRVSIAIEQLEDRLAALGKAADTGKSLNIDIVKPNANLLEEDLEVIRQREALQKQVDALDSQAFQEQLQEGARVFEETRTPLEQYTAEIERLNGLLDAGTIGQETFERASAKAGKALIDSFISTQQLSQGISQLVTGQKTFAEVGLDIANQVLPKLIEAMIKAAIQGKVLQSVLGSFGGAGGGGGSAGLFSGLGFAEGGRPPVGKASVVGEKGKELFVPDRAGTIIPNNRLGGMVGAPMEITIKNEFVVSGIPGQVQRELAEQLPVMERRMIDAVGDAVSRGGGQGRAIRGFG